MNKKILSLFEIAIMVFAIISFSYFLSENSSLVMSEDLQQPKSSSLLELFAKYIVGDSGIVSAANIIPPPVDYLCVKTNDGKDTCKVYTTRNQAEVQKCKDECAYGCTVTGPGKTASCKRQIDQINSDSSAAQRINSLAADVQIYTCVQSKTNSYCQEYGDLNECNNACNGQCINAQSSNIDSCKTGSCYDPDEGTCSANTPKLTCEKNGGEWDDDPNANGAQCLKACCVVGDQRIFGTERQCEKIGETSGIHTTFNKDIRTEFACILQASTQQEGACVYNDGDEKTCKFTTQDNCLRIIGNQNVKDFHPNTLCSNPDLGTNCVSQQSAKCFTGKDELFWVDSCGNRENIYDANKQKSFNGGMVLSKDDSCSLTTGNNLFANQKTCGNCNSFSSSICGSKTSNEKLADNNIGFVCRDLSCTDKDGKKRVNGESWCAYQGDIGLEGNGLDTKSVDTPGSEHFRQSCINGEIVSETCGAYRSGICVQTDAKLDNGKVFSTATCKVNRADECIGYNSQYQDDPGQMQKACTSNPDCNYKKQVLSDKMQFNICLPKYPKGYDSSSESSREYEKQLCSFANIKCTVIYQIDEFGSKKCVANCDCRSASFAQKMNDFCMSLGDCGASTNYIGDVTNNYKVSNSPGLSSTYISQLKSYAKPVDGKFAQPNSRINNTNIATAIAQSGGLAPKEAAGIDPIQMVGTVAGLAGPTITYLTANGMLSGLVGTYTPVTAGASGAAGTTLTPIASSSTAYTDAVAQAGTGGTVDVALNGLGNGIMAGLAIIGIAVTFYGLIQKGDYTGMAVAAVAGIATGLIAAEVFNLAWTAALGFAGLAVALVALLLSFFGGTEEVQVEFKCLPWQAPTGGAKCDLCGQDKGNSFIPKSGSTSNISSMMKCSKYECQSLGQNCQLINPNSDNQLCINVNPDDVLAPTIKPWKKVFSDGNTITETSNGYKITGTAEEGCLTPYQQIDFGISLNEPGQCKIDVVKNKRFDDMQELLSSGYFLYNHTITEQVPSLESLGVSGYDPSRKADFNLYIKCQDKSGNQNTIDYTVNFCIKPGADRTAPLINARIPAKDFAGYNQTVFNASIYVNEPSECRYSLNDKDYELMENNMTCLNSLNQQQISGWLCSANMSITKDDEKYYIRCKDQPWLVEDDGTGKSKLVYANGVDSSGNTVYKEIKLNDKRTRNVNVESFLYTIKRSNTPLTISSISPNDKTLTYGTQPVSIGFEVKTSGGAENGKAVCSYIIGGNKVDFFKTNSNTHTQTLQSFFSGSYKLDVQCKDAANNIVSGTSNFNIQIDANAPQITRLYKKSSSLYVITNEDATCYVSNKYCDFDTTNSTIASTMIGNGKEHIWNFNNQGRIYIKCKDNYGNYPGLCQAIVSEGRI